MRKRGRKEEERMDYKVLEWGMVKEKKLENARRIKGEGEIEKWHVGKRKIMEREEKRRRKTRKKKKGHEKYYVK